MIISAVLFDLDGTLVDSLEYLTGADAMVHTPHELLAVIAAGFGTRI